MTDPGLPSFLDIANSLLSQVPVRLELGAMMPPGGVKTGVLTLRSATTTMTALLSAEEMRSWAGMLAQAAASLEGGNSAVVPASAADVVALQAELHPSNGRRPKA